MSSITASKALEPTPGNRNKLINVYIPLFPLQTARVRARPCLHAVPTKAWLIAPKRTEGDLIHDFHLSAIIWFYWPIIHLVCVFSQGSRMKTEE